MEGRTSSRAVEVMSEAHLQRVLQWAGELGWNPGQRDAEPFRTADRDGFFSIEQDGDVMAGESCRNSGSRLRKDTTAGVPIGHSHFKERGVLVGIARGHFPVHAPCTTGHYLRMVDCM